MQALMFAMYFAAITSLTPQECMTEFGEQKTELLARYRYGTEQALVQADILNSMEMVTLQALVIYLVCTTATAVLDNLATRLLSYKVGDWR